jgi:hypothetical protein
MAVLQGSKVIADMWDHCDSEGEVLTSWNDYAAHMAKDRKWGGELECLAAMQKWKLSIVAVRLGAPTIVAGEGRAFIWFRLCGARYEALETTDDPEGQIIGTHSHRGCPCLFEIEVPR